MWLNINSLDIICGSINNYGYDKVDEELVIEVCKHLGSYLVFW